MSVLYPPLAVFYNVPRPRRPLRFLNTSKFMVLNINTNESDMSRVCGLALSVVLTILQNRFSILYFNFHLDVSGFH